MAMEPISAAAIVIGLVSSLKSTLQVFRDFATRFSLDEKHNHDFNQIETVLAGFGPHLLATRDSLRVELETLVLALDAMESHLHRLYDAIDALDKLQRKRVLLLRWHRPSLSQDTDAAKYNIRMALDMGKMIRNIQFRTFRGNAFVDNTGLSSERRYSASGDLIVEKPESLRHSDLSYSIDTRIQEIFARIAGPEMQYKFHDQCRSQRIVGTCEWFLSTKEYKTWSRSNESIFCCKGEPGIGKTMLASKVIDELRTAESVVAFFYIEAHGRCSAIDIIANLVRQLCLPLQVLPECLKDAYDRSQNNPEVGLKLEDMLEALLETSRSIDEPITIVLDGLDQLNPSEQTEIMKVMDQLKESGCKCLVTSRPTQSLWNKQHDDYYKYSIQDKNTAKDIRNFIESALSENKALDKMLSGDRKLKRDVVDTLTSRSHGKFHWAILQMQHILEQVHLSGIRQALERVPNQISGVVKNAIHLIGLQEHSRANLALRTLALLTNSKAALTADALCDALGLAHILESDRYPDQLSRDEIPNIASIYESCKGLITVVEPTRIVTLAHHDIAKFMRENWENVFPKGLQAATARIYMVYLSLKVFSTGPCADAGSLSDRLRHYPLLDYASRYWHYHAREAFSLPEVGAMIRERAGRFLDAHNNVRSFLQVADMDPDTLQALQEGRLDGITLDTSSLEKISTLRVAARMGFTNIVQDLILRDPNSVLAKGIGGNSALHEASRAGWTEIVTILLDNGADPLAKDGKGKRPLYYAAERGHADVVSKLLLAGDVPSPEQPRSPVDQSEDETDGSEGSAREQLAEDQELQLEEAFCDAVNVGNVHATELLLRDNVGPNPSKKGVSALLLAVQGGHKVLVDLLLHHGADPDDSGPSNQPTPLHEAISLGHVKIAAALLNTGANMEAEDDVGRTALFKAVSAHDINGALLLLQYGASLLHTDRYQNTVLHEAVAVGAFDHSVLFIDQGIDLEIRNDRDFTPLMLAIESRSSRVVDYLLQSGASPCQLPARTDSPLLLATGVGNADVVALLVAKGAGPNERDGQTLTPLMLAASAGHIDIVRILLQAGADANSKDFQSRTPVMLAAAAGHVDVVRFLLNVGADINCRDQKSYTAVMHAASAGHSDVVRILRQAGAVFDRQDQESQNDISKGWNTNDIITARMISNREQAGMFSRNLGLQSVR